LSLPAVIASVFILAALASFVIATAVRAWRYARLPLHSRLELYPVPKEGAGRARYGGSYFEEPEWWKKPRAINKLNEVWNIIMEMFFIRKLFENKKSLWWASYAFHLGIYVLFGWTVLLGISVVVGDETYRFFVTAAGVTGFVLTGTGALLLLLRRLFDSSLRKYTSALDYGNLLLILAVLATGAWSWVFVTSPFEVAAGILCLKGAVLAPLIIVHLFLLGGLLVYIPLSKMSHYVAKFFSFHKVLWENEPNLANTDTERRFLEAASRTPQTQWSAPHTNPTPPNED
jgi:nitrate reductase gamma subunit